MRDRLPVRFLFILILLTVLVRAFLIAATPDAFAADPDAYRAIADTVSESGVFGLTGADGNTRPTAFRPPLYPFLLSIFLSGGAPRLTIGALHVLLAVITSACVFLSTLRLVDRLGPDSGRWSPPWLAMASGLIVVIDPVLLRQSTEVMTETLAVTLASVAMWLWLKWIDRSPLENLKLGFAIGLVVSLAYFCRPTFLVWAVCLNAIMIGLSRDKPTKVGSLLAAAMVCISVFVWTSRNVVVMGHSIWATSHGGYTLLLANNESFYDYLANGESGQAWDATAFLNAYKHRFEADPRERDFWTTAWTGQPKIDESVHGDVITEFNDDRLCYEAAVATIKRRPKMFLWSCFVRAGRFWSPTPHGVGSRSARAIFAVTGFYVLLLTAAGVALVRHRRFFFTRPWWCMWVLAFTLTGIHAVFWSNMRMRAPVAPAIAMMAVFVLVPRSDISRSESFSPAESDE